MNASRNVCCRIVTKKLSTLTKDVHYNGFTQIHIIKRHCSTNNDTSEPKDLNTLNQKLRNISSKKDFWEYGQKETGHVYDKKPVKVHCKEGKLYMWCSCGRSNNQPFCDGTHRMKHFKIDLKPIPFKCEETKDYWFCNCKQSKMKPFCDGTHKEECVQKATSTIRY